MKPAGFFRDMHKYKKVVEPLEEAVLVNWSVWSEHTCGYYWKVHFSTAFSGKHRIFCTGNWHKKVTWNNTTKKIRGDASIQMLHKANNERGEKQWGFIWLLFSILLSETDHIWCRLTAAEHWAIKCTLVARFLSNGLIFAHFFLRSILLYDLAWENKHGGRLRPGSHCGSFEIFENNHHTLRDTLIHTYIIRLHYMYGTIWDYCARRTDASPHMISRGSAKWRLWRDDSL